MRLGHVAGIPVGLHYSWLIIATLITVSLGARFSETHAGWSPLLVWSTAVVTAALFFVTLLAHELSHMFVARARGLPVRSITLFALGGVAHIEKDATSAKTEALVAIAGPITSFALGFGCVAVAQSLGWTPADGAPGVVGTVLGWLGSINIVLAIFNLLPGYPLDGGRLLKAVLWGLYGDGERATQHAARAGQAVAVVIIAFGLFQFLFGPGVGGLWLSLIGWFLLIAAQASRAEVAIAQTLREVRVSDIMTTDCVTVDGDATLDHLVDEVLLRSGRRCVMVGVNGRVVGLVTPRDVREVNRSQWAHVTTRDVMRPLETVKTVTPETSASDALRMMASEDVNQLPVLADSHLAGVVSRSEIIQLLQARAELGA